MAADRGSRRSHLCHGLYGGVRLEQSEATAAGAATARRGGSSPGSRTARHRPPIPLQF